MSGPFETAANDIVALTDVQLTQLVHRLLILEAETLGLPKRKVDVSLNIDTPDGGEDGRIEWQGDPDPTESNWLPRRLCLFQMKATDLGPSKCRGEVLIEKDGVKALKPRVAEAVQGAGSYLLCYSRPCAGTHVTERIDAFRAAFAEVVGADTAAATDIQVYGAERLSTWVNEHAAAVTFVLGCLGRGLPAGLQTWTSWERTSRADLSFQTDQARSDISAELRGTLGSPGGVARLAGLSGLGKSRTALELLRPPPNVGDDPEQAALSAACVYVGDAAGCAEATRAALLDLLNRDVRAVVVADECPLDLHSKLESIASAEGSKLSLLTLDFDPASNPRSSQCRFFKLDPFQTDRMVELLRQSNAHVPEGQLSKVAELAQGYPRMAQLLVEALRDGRDHLWDLVPTAVVERLVVRRAPAGERERVLRIARALSIFEHIGVDGVAAHELDRLAQHVVGEARDDLYEVIRNLEEAGIAYRRGDYVRITPLPIAVTLAGEWWRGRSPERARELLLGGQLTAPMVDATANQLKRLSGHAWVQRLVGDLYGAGSPFRQRDLLDSALGSRVASSLAEVNPKAVCDALTHVFGALTPEEARTIHSGRRDLVWCLEKLAWWPETFQDAAWLLLLLAAGENETWGNNATNQFAALFHIYLGGTETPAPDRLAVLRRALSMNDPALEPVVVKALDEALAAGHFTRMGGHEVQGGRFPRKDWEPRTHGEIWSYWRGALHLLRPFLLREDELGRAAREGVGNSARGMIGWGAILVIEEVVAMVMANRAWPEMLDGLRSALNYDGEEYPPELRSKVEALVAALAPTDLPTRLSTVVSTPTWNELRKEPDGHVVVVAEERAEELGRELAADIDALMPYVPALVRGEQRQGYRFGRTVGMNVQDPLALLISWVPTYLAIPEAERNAVMLAGIAEAASARDLGGTRAAVRRLFADPTTRELGFRCMLSIKPDDGDLALVSEQLRERAMPSSLAHSLAFGGLLLSLRPDTVGQLVSACARADASGPLVALELLGMRTHRRVLEAELLPVARDLLLGTGVFELVARQRGGLGDHHFENLVRDYLNQTKDAEFARSLARSLVVSLSDQASFPASHTVRKLLEFLLEADCDATWPEIRRGFEEDDGRVALRLELTIEKMDVVRLVGEARLLDWCDSSERARHWVARMVEPLQDPDSPAAFPHWTAFALTLIERFGSDADVRSSLGASIYSGGWSGSAVPRLTRHRDAFQELTRHPNRDVARWAIESVAGLDAEIERETKRDEEREFGILR